MIAFQEAIEKPKNDHKTSLQEIIGLFKKSWNFILFNDEKLSKQVFGLTNNPSSIPECQLAITNEIKENAPAKNKSNSLKLYKTIDRKHENIIKKCTHLCHKHNLHGVRLEKYSK